MAAGGRWADRWVGPLLLDRGGWRRTFGRVAAVSTAGAVMLVAADMWTSVADGLLALVAFALLFASAPVLFLCRPGLMSRLVVYFTAGAAVVVLVELPPTVPLGRYAVADMPSSPAAISPARSVSPSVGKKTPAPGVTASPAVVAPIPSPAVSPAAGSGREIRATWVVRLVLGTALLALVLRLLLLRRFASGDAARGGIARRDQQQDPLFEFQRTDLERLHRTILASRPDDEAPVFQLIGRWGEGKSYLVNRLGDWADKACAEGEDPCAVVVVDVWKHESEPDLHLAVVEEILAHPRLWFPYGWTLYPFWLLAVRFAKEARLAVEAGKTTKARLEMPLQVPRLTGQRALARVVRASRRRGCRIVVVLDEIDRATPVMAQAAMTLARRSLDMAGLIVVVSYVEPLIRYKAFNPLVEAMPDLGSTMEAVLFRELLDTPDSELSRDVQRPPVDSLVGSGAWKPRSDDHGIPPILQSAYASTGWATRRQLQDLFSEKYLGTSPQYLAAPSLADIAKMPFKIGILREVVKQLLGSTDETVRSATETITRAGLERWAQVQGWQRSQPPIRALKGAMYHALTAATKAPEGHGSMSPGFVASVIVAAYDAAARQMPEMR